MQVINIKVDITMTKTELLLEIINTVNDQCFVR